MGNNLILSKNGTFPQKDPLEPLIVVGSSITEDLKMTADLERFTKSRLLETKSLKDIAVQSERSVRIDGLDGYLVDAFGTDKASESRLFVKHCILYTDFGYYIFQGMVGEQKQHHYNPFFYQVLYSLEANY